MASEREGLAVISLGAIAPRIAADRAVAMLDDLPTELAVMSLRRHKALLASDERLAAVAAAGGREEARARELRDGIEPFVTNAIRRQMMLEARLGLLHQIAATRGIGIAAIKGLSSSLLYPRGGQRDLGDIDLYVRTVDEAWELGQALVERGYHYDLGEAPWIKRAPDDRLYGQIRLRAPRGAQDLDVEIHFDRHAVRHCAWLELRSSIPPGSLTTLDPIESFPFVVADAAGDCFISTKLLNDLYRLLELEGVELGSLIDRLRGAKLERFFDTIARRLEQSLVVSERQRLVLGQALTGASEPMPPPVEPDPRSRLKVTMTHAFRVGLERSLLTAVRNWLSAFAYYRRPLRLQLRRRARPVRVSAASPTNCMRLIPAQQASNAAEDGVSAYWSAVTSRNGRTRDGGTRDGWLPIPGAARMRRLPTAAGDLVRVDDEVFIPTIWFRVPTELVALAATPELTG